MSFAAIPREIVAARRLPVVPFLVLVVGVIAGVTTGLAASNGPQGVVLAGLLCTLAGIAALDCLTLRAPNRIVYPAAAIATAAPFALGVNSGLNAVLGAALAFAAVLIVVALGRGAMGYGDAKVAWICGAIVGVPNLLLFFVAAFAIGGSFAALALTLGGRGRKESVAFTPFLFAGVIFALALGEVAVYRVTGF